MTPRLEPVDPSSLASSGSQDAISIQARHCTKTASASATTMTSSLLALSSNSMEVLQAQTNQERWSDTNFQAVVDRWRLTEAEQQQLREFQRRLSDLDHWKNNPMDVVRYMKGPGKFEQIVVNYREMIAWRISYGADRLLEEYRPPRALLYYVPSAILKGYDKEGDPIYLERGGVMDGIGFQRYPREDIIRHIVWLREISTRGHWINEYEAATGKPPNQVTIIYDMHGMSSRHLKTMSFFKEIVKVNQKMYCGLAKRIIIIRAPSIFNIIWNIAKHFFPPEGQKLMVFTTAGNYLSVLDKFVDLKVLPPSVCKEGQGGAIDCMPQNFKGGNLPPNAEASIPDEPWINDLINTAKTQRRRAQERQHLLATSAPSVERIAPTLPPVCISEHQNVQVLKSPQAHEQDEYETVWVK